jgi:hypothetical protein
MIDRMVHLEDRVNMISNDDQWEMHLLWVVVVLMAAAVVDQLFHLLLRGLDPVLVLVRRADMIPTALLDPWVHLNNHIVTHATYPHLNSSNEAAAAVLVVVRA